MRRHRALLLLAAVLAAAPAAVGCATNPLTGERNFMLLSSEDDIQLGVQAAPEMVKELGGSYGDPVMKAYVQGIGQKVAAKSVEAGGYAYPYSFDVVDTDMVNAFALPGGPICVTRGLLFQMEDESQLAGVLAHEVTHVAARHSAQQISKSVAAEVLFAVVGAAASSGGSGGGGGGLSDVGKVVGAMINLKYSRDNEIQADTYGVDFAVRAGYSPGGIIRVMEMFQQQEAESGGSGPEFLRTHPYPETRIENIRTMIAEKYPGSLTDSRLITGRDTYQKNVLSRQSLVKQYSTNPSN